MVTGYLEICFLWWPSPGLYSALFSASWVPIWEMNHLLLLLGFWFMPHWRFSGGWQQLYSCNLNCLLVKSPGNFFNNTVVALVFHVSICRSSKSSRFLLGLCMLFYGYIHPSFIPVKNKMFIRLFRLMSEWFLSFSSGKANALSVFSVLLSVAYLTGLTCALQPLS